MRVRWISVISFLTGSRHVYFNLSLGTSKYVKKEKVKPVEEVIDVVGDFGPIKTDETKYPTEENFTMSFDVGDQSQLQDQSAIMMPPQIGKFFKM